MQEPSIFLCQTYLASNKMREVVMHTAEPASKIKSNEIMVNVIYITYAKVYLKHVAANADQMNSEKMTKLTGLLNKFENLFDGNL